MSRAVRFPPQRDPLRGLHQLASFPHNVLWPAELEREDLKLKAAPMHRGATLAAGQGTTSKGFWAVTVRANWRVIFRFADRDVLDVDYVDDH